MDSFDLTVVGGGPGGYVAAIRAAQLGLSVALVEKRATLGGTCLNVGCIPSKALLESSHLYAQARSGALGEHGLKLGDVSLDLAVMMARKNRLVEQLTGGIAGLMKKSRVEVLTGTGRLNAADRVEVEGEGQKTEIHSRHVLLATGSVPAELPGLAFDGERIVSSTEALSFGRVPGHLVVVGAGAVGLELGLVWHRLGARVTVVEMMPQVVPSADKMIARMMLRSLKGKGLEFLLGSRVTSAEPDGDGLRVTVAAPGDRLEELCCDKLLVAVGRRPYFEGLGLEEAGVELDDRGRVAVDEKLRTSVPNILAIGDLAPGPMLAHKAEEEGVSAAELVAGLPGHVDHDLIPAVVYTTPELAQVGLTEEQAKEQGLEYKAGRFYFQANSRALASGEADGLVKILASKETGRILGVHILGPQASELIAEAVLAMKYKATADDLARTVHAHPTLSEAIKEASLAVDGRAIHA